MSPGIATVSVIGCGLLVAIPLVRRGAATPLGSLADAIALGPLVGYGLLSLGHFFALYCGFRHAAATAGASVAVAIAIVSAGTTLPRRAAPATGEAPPGLTAIMPLSAWCIAGGVLAVAAGGLTWLFDAWNELRPFGEFDAMAIWNVRARTLFRADGDLGAVLQTFEIGHPDYPLMIPAAIAGQWTLLGAEDTVTPQLVAHAMTIGLVLVTVRATWRLAGPVFAAPAALFVLAAPHTTLVGQSQIADVPLAALLVVAGVGLASVWSRDPSRIARPVTTGLCLGLLPWCKNEGLALALMLAVAHVVFLIAGRLRGRTAPPHLAALLAGAALPLLAVTLFKLTWSPTNDLTRDIGDVFGSNITDPARWRLTWDGLWAQLASPEWHERWGLVWPLVALGLVLFLRPQGLRDGAVRFMTLLLPALAAAWFMVYVLTPRPQQWHIDTSMHRLMLHLFPLTVVWILCLASTVKGRMDEAAPTQAKGP